MTKEKSLLYAHILLDRSGSMASIRNRTVDSVNEYLNGLKVDPDMDAAVSLTLFDHYRGAADLESVIDGKPAAEVTPLIHSDFVPRGGTPLNDAIGAVVQRMQTQWHRPNEKIALVIVTDGEENASVRYSTDAVKELIRGVEAQGWLVMYLGANQDAFAEAAKYGIGRNATLNFAAENIKGATTAALRSTKSYASVGLAASAFTEEERRNSL